jgi:hypothetical protein
MAVYSYQLAGGKTRWLYIIDLPPGQDGKRRQQKRRGYLTSAAAAKAVSGANTLSYGLSWLLCDSFVLGDEPAEDGAAFGPFVCEVNGGTVRSGGRICNAPCGSRPPWPRWSAGPGSASR